MEVKDYSRKEIYISEVKINITTKDIAELLAHKVICNKNWGYGDSKTISVIINLVEDIENKKTIK